jgi:hypothetical protein
MVDMHTLTGLDLGQLRQAAADWGWVASRLRQASEGFQYSVAGSLAAEQHWSGDDAKAAAQTGYATKHDIDAVVKEAQAVHDFLSDVIDGTGDGFVSLRAHQQRARELLQEASGKGLTVEADGSVHLYAQAPGPITPEAKQQQDEALNRRTGIESELKQILTAANNIDDSLSRGLKVIFGTEETFRSEDRSRLDKNDAGMGDGWVESELGGVRAALNAKGWNDAAMLLGHFMDTTGTTVQVDADRMLSDMPSFRRDVDTTLSGVKQRPDGNFETPWQNSRPDISNGDDKSLNWYYALNNFEYRTVGQKQGNQVTYHVEVRKRYDWGTPSEHRRDLDKGPLHFEQSELARLNLVGLAKDFDVTGKTASHTAYDVGNTVLRGRSEALDEQEEGCPVVRGCSAAGPDHAGRRRRPVRRISGRSPHRRVAGSTDNADAQCYPVMQQLRVGLNSDSIPIRGRFRPVFYPGIDCLVWVVGSRQEMVFSPVRRRAMRSVMAMWIMASERAGRVS